MVDHIRGELGQLALREQVRVLYACESGSRAWGFASPDSDYDVRFLYIHCEDWYLSIQQGRDVIEAMLPRDLDLSGWELRKALRLLMKSNPPLLEWLNSPIVYSEDSAFVARLRELATEHYSPRNCFAHYRSMARTNYRTYLQGERVRTKKYLYVVRPLLACRWIERGLGMVPVPFADLVGAMAEPQELRTAIDSLLARKAAGFEAGEEPADPVLSAFIAKELDRLETVDLPAPPEIDSSSLDALFRTTLR